MAIWARWSPENMLYPCPQCPGDVSVDWPARLATRRDADTEERRNDDCDHVLIQAPHFQQTTEDDPRAEWVTIDDWDPPVG